jgi:hypothetical protein
MRRIHQSYQRHHHLRPNPSLLIWSKPAGFCRADSLCFGSLPPKKRDPSATEDAGHACRELPSCRLSVNTLASWAVPMRTRRMCPFWMIPCARRGKLSTQPINATFSSSYQRNHNKLQAFLKLLEFRIIGSAGGCAHSG